MLDRTHISLTNFKVQTSRRRNKSSRRHFRNGQRAAALRAITAGRLYLDKAVPTLAAAASACGSNVNYVQAAVVLLRYGDNVLIEAVLNGAASILEAAHARRPVVELTRAYRTADPVDRILWAEREGVEKIFTDVLEPAIA